MYFLTVLEGGKSKIKGLAFGEDLLAGSKRANERKKKGKGVREVSREERGRENSFDKGSISMIMNLAKRILLILSLYSHGLTIFA